MKEGIIMVIIVGSRREGNAYYLANKIKEGLAKERIRTTIITPGNQKIHLCTGCMDCDKNGVCDFTDDMKNNIDILKNEEHILFITPTRWNILSGDLKIFMDRLNPMYATQDLKGKKMIAVAIAAKGKELYSSEAAISSLLSFAESAKMDVVLTKEFNNCLYSNDILNKENEVQDFINDLVKLINA